MTDWIAFAEQEVAQTYGDRVSATAKRKGLTKFGRNTDLDTAAVETVWSQGGNETYISTNGIDTISSSDAGDTSDVRIEGHTVTGTGADQEFTFVVQTATLNGQNKVTLDTPVARVSRMFNRGSTDYVGSISAYEDTAITAGVPDDATKTHATISAGDQQTFKAATTFSNVDYAFITEIYGSVRRANAAVADFELQVRSAGGVFREQFSFSVARESGMVSIQLRPFLIVPKNADVRLVAGTTANNTQVDAGFSAVLALVV